MSSRHWMNECSRCVLSFIGMFYNFVCKHLSISTKEAVVLNWLRKPEELFTPCWRAGYYYYEFALFDVIKSIQSTFSANTNHKYSEHSLERWCCFSLKFSYSCPLLYSVPFYFFCFDSLMGSQTLLFPIHCSMFALTHTHTHTYERILTLEFHLRWTCLENKNKRTG